LASEPCIGCHAFTALWSTDGRIAYPFSRAEYLGDQFPSPTDRCEFHARDAAGRPPAVLWAGTWSDFAESADCPGLLAWHPPSGRILVAEYAFESPMSTRLSLLAGDGGGIVARPDIHLSWVGVAASPDGSQAAIVDSAAYRSADPFAALLFSYPDFPPDPARLRLFDLVSGTERTVAAWPTDVGFAAPVWSADGAWLAFAQPHGNFHPLEPPDDARWKQESTTIWVLNPTGKVVTELPDLPPDSWPVASSPDGRHLLVHQGAIGTGTQVLSTYSIPDGAGGPVAVIGGARSAVAWVR
jgi:hypothetical protein